MILKTRDGKTLSVSDQVFAVDFNEALIHQTITAYRAGARAGTKAQKTRSEVSGGGRKPWRQKGTGHARAGTIRSPLWRKGGKIFAAKPRSFEQKINKKMYRQAMRSIVSELLRQDAIWLFEDFSVPEAKTRFMAAKLAELGVSNVLILMDKEDRNLILSARNLPNVALDLATHVDPYHLLRFQRIIATTEAMRQLEARLQ
jgi:large subunit ribosomal protein L4